ncbi:MAG: molybdenum cofactor sulfurase [Mesorhizobium sp.]|nr:molybdenum cofactor sulfurase [Mesorhizobium sp.]
MLDMFDRDEEIEIRPSRKLTGRVSGVFVAPSSHFVTRPVDGLDLTFEGIVGDLHAGMTRRTGGREPWYPRGTEIRNERHLSIVAPDELAKVARLMGIAEVKAEWIGANLTLSDVPHLSMLPAGTMLFFKGGVTLKIDGQNIPCRIAGRSIAEHAGMPDREAGSLLFPKVARRLRGLVAWVEKPGRIEAGEQVSVRVPEQWTYRA